VNEKGGYAKKGKTKNCFKRVNEKKRAVKEKKLFLIGETK